MSTLLLKHNYVTVAGKSVSMVTGLASAVKASNSIDAFRVKFTSAVVRCTFVDI